MTRTAIAMIVLGAACLTPQAAAGAAETPAVCHVEVHAAANPGLWANRPAEGSTSETKPGTVTCTGAIRGQRLAAAPGAFSMTFSFGSNGVGPSPARDTDCFHGWTTGQWKASIPTADGGTVDLGGPFSGAWTGLVWRAGGRLGDQTVTAVGETRGDPDHSDEDCVTKAFTHFIDTGQLVIGG